MGKKSRRDFIKKIGETSTTILTTGVVGALVASSSSHAGNIVSPVGTAPIPNAKGQGVVAAGGGTTPKRTVTLRIKVPHNVTVIPEFIQQSNDLAIDLPANLASPNVKPVLEMDLTSQKTSAWLRKKTISIADCSNCCCVRG
jgi:hypothetical protein